MQAAIEPVGPESTARRSAYADILAMLGILAVSYISVGLFMSGLGFQFVRDDIIDFWNDSFALNTPFAPSRMPGYPVLLAVARTVTFGALPHLIVMMAVNLIFLLAGAWCVSEIARLNGASRGQAMLAGMLFGLWPLSGLPFTVYPLSDVPATSIFILGVYFLQRSQKWTGIALIAMAMMAHKIIWPLGILTVIGAALSEKPRPPVLSIAARLAVTVLPIIILWIAGAVYYQSITWLVGWNIDIHIVSNSNLPVLDGALGTLLQGGFKGIFKGGYLLGIAALAVYLGYELQRKRPPMYWYGTAICCVMVGVWLLLNQYEIWALARFARLLEIPIMLVWVGSSDPAKAPSRHWRIIAPAGVLALLASQFVYAWYMVRVFYS